MLMHITGHTYSGRAVFVKTCVVLEFVDDDDDDDDQAANHTVHLDNSSLTYIIRSAYHS